MKVAFKVFFSIVVAAAVVCGFFIWRFEKNPVSENQTELLKVGMSKAEVELLLGPPAKVSNNQDEWTYSQPMSWPIFYVSFDMNGRLVSWELDR